MTNRDDVDRRPYVAAIREAVHTSRRRSALALVEAAEAEITQELYKALKGVRDDAATYDAAELDDGEGNVGIDARLNVQVADDGESYSWMLKTGDPQYDTDHRGYWGNGFVGRSADDATLTEEARSIFADMLEYCDSSMP